MWLQIIVNDVSQLLRVADAERKQKEIKGEEGGEMWGRWGQIWKKNIKWHDESNCVDVYSQTWAASSVNKYRKDMANTCISKRFSQSIQNSFIYIAQNHNHKEMRRSRTKSKKSVLGGDQDGPLGQTSTGL